MNNWQIGDLVIPKDIKEGFLNDGGAMYQITEILADDWFFCESWDYSTKMNKSSLINICWLERELEGIKNA